MSFGGWEAEITLDLWRGIGGAIAAVIGGDPEMWLDAIGRALGATLGSAAMAHWIGCQSRQITGAAIGALSGYGLWLLVLVAAGLFPKAHEMLRWLLIDTSEIEFVASMLVVTMVGTAIGSAGAVLQPTRLRVGK